MTRGTDRKPPHLNVFLMWVGHHEAARRLPEGPACGCTDIEHRENLARIAERGLPDSLFARRLASGDHVSGGRAGWNVATTAGHLGIAPLAEVQ